MIYFKYVDDKVKDALFSKYKYPLNWLTCCPFPFVVTDVSQTDNLRLWISLKKKSIKRWILLCSSSNENKKKLAVIINDPVFFLYTLKSGLVFRAHVTRPLVWFHNLASRTIQNGGAQCWILPLFGEEFQWDWMQFRS